MRRCVGLILASVILVSIAGAVTGGAGLGATTTASSRVVLTLRRLLHRLHLRTDRVRIVCSSTSNAGNVVHTSR